MRADPELALRATAERFRDRVEAAERLAGARGERWPDLDFDAQLTYYAHAQLTPEDS